jgi:hypothetical protein
MGEETIKQQTTRRKKRSYTIRLPAMLEKRTSETLARSDVHSTRYGIHSMQREDIAFACVAIETSTLPLLLTHAQVDPLAPHSICQADVNRKYNGK